MSLRTLSEPSAATQKRRDSQNLIDIDDNPPSTLRRSSAVVRTYSSPMTAGVFFEAPRYTSPSSNLDGQYNDDEIIIVSVRLSSRFGHEHHDELPSRPQPRGYLRRVSTRLRDPMDKDTFKAVQMPRRDYNRLFRRDRDGAYAGTEPERQWTQVDIDREFGKYQHLPLRSILTSPSSQQSNSFDGYTRNIALAVPN